MPFHTNLEPPVRDALFAYMRELDADSLFYFEKAKETPGTIPVGSALFDDTIQGAVRLELVMALRTAETPEAAYETAVQAVRLWVEKHNAKRKDKDWKRWTEHGQDKLRFLFGRVSRILTPESRPPV